MPTPRQDIIEIFEGAFHASRVEKVIEERIQFHGEAMEADGFHYALTAYDRCMLIAIGKAAESMLSSFLARSGSAAQLFEGVIVAPDPVVVPSERFVAFHAGHPSPNVESIRAAETILKLLNDLTERDLVIFLISGGGSSLMEQFLEEGTSLETIAATHKALVESAAPITAINAVRKHLSSVKGGRLAAAAAPAEQLTIAISDVPAGRLDALASGPTTPDASTLADVYDAVERYGLMERLPLQIAARLADHSLEETPKSDDAIFARSRWLVLMDSATLEAAAEKSATEMGWNVVIDNSCDDWSAEAAASYLVERVRELRQEKERVCLLSAGEVTVLVPHGSSGKGGRNQQFVLEAAKLIVDEEITVLSVGSDGVDGNSPAAGGVVDGATVARAQREGYPLNDALAEFNSYSLLERLQDAIVIGPTGNNLRDLRVLLAP